MSDYRVDCGGSWHSPSPARGVRSAGRIRIRLGGRGNSLGFRPVRAFKRGR